MYVAIFPTINVNNRNIWNDANNWKICDYAELIEN